MSQLDLSLFSDQILLIYMYMFFYVAFIGFYTPHFLSGYYLRKSFLKFFFFRYCSYFSYIFLNLITWSLSFFFSYCCFQKYVALRFFLQKSTTFCVVN